MVVCAMWCFLLAVFAATLLFNDVGAQGEVPLQCYNTNNCSDGSKRGNLPYSQCCSEGLGFFEINGTCYGCRDLISFSRETYSVPESGQFVHLTVRRAVNPGTDPFYFKIVIKQGTATGGLDFGHFLEPTSEVIGVMLPNEMETGSGIVIRDDDIVENEENFTASLQLVSRSLAPLGGVLQTAVVAIVDDDKASIIVLPVNSNATNLTAVEGDNPIHLSINKIGETVRSVSVDLLPPAGHDVTYTMNGEFLSGVTRLTFEPDERQKFLVVTITDDVIVEASERHDIVFSIPANETGVDLLNPSFPLTVEDNDKLDVDMVVPAVSVPEERGYVVLEMVKKGQNERSVFLNFLTEGHSATAGVDFSVESRILEFRDIDTHLSVNVTIFDDLIVESTEIFSCRIVPAEGERGVTVTNSTTSVSVTDTDSIIIHVDPSTLSVTEGQGTASIFLRVQGQIARDIVVDVSQNPTDTSDLILPNPSTVTFDPSTRNRTYQLSVVDDSLYEGTQSITISMTSSDSAVRFSRSPAEVIVSITDDDSPQLSFAQSVYMFNELAGTVEVSVTFAAQTEQSHTWNLNFIPVSATVNKDYIASSSQSLTFDNNTRLHTVSFQIIDDDLGEGLENITLVLQDQVGKIEAESTVVIVDNEKIEINFGKSSYSVSEGDRLVLLELTKSGVSSSDIVVGITFEDGTAKSGQDYGFFPTRTHRLRTIIAMQETSTQYGVLIREDDIIENTEFFSVSLESLPNVDGSVLLGNMTHVQVEIKDNDKVNISITLENSTVISEASADLPLVFTVSRDPNVTFDSNRAVVVMLNALENSATEPEDYYLPAPRVFAFSQNVTTFYSKLAVRNDDIVENAEQFSVTLVTTPTELGAILPDSSTVITITSEDKIKVSFSRTSYTVNEGGGVVTITVAKEGTNEIPVLVSVEIRTIAATAKAGKDFNSSIQPLEFLSAGSPQLTLTIPILDDNVLESDEVFTVQLIITANDTNVELGNSTAVHVTIVDNDRVAVEFSNRGEVEVREKDGGATVTVVLVGEVERDVIVMLSTKHGTADSTDYTPLTTSLTFRSGEHQKNMTLNIIDDNECENEETFSISLSSPDADSQSINVTIIDDETCGVGFERIFYTVTEPNTSGGKKLLQVCIMKNGSHSQKDITVVVVASDIPNTPLEQRATANADFIFIPSPLMLPSDQNSTCTSIIILGDSLPENTEKFMIRLVVADEDVRTFNSEADVSIIDQSDETPSPTSDPLPQVEFEFASYSVDESSQQVEIAIVLEGMRDPSQFIGVIFSTSNGTAISPMDFVAQPSTAVPFPPGSNQTGVTVEIVDDSQVEMTESFTVSLSLPPTSIGLKLGAQTTATVIIFDSDVPDSVVVNDTVLGDPLFVVPLNFASGRQLFGDDVPHLCFEIHGQNHWYFNLVSDLCTSVNAFYESQKTNNIITNIGVKVIDSFNRCVQIEVDSGNACNPVVSRGGMQVAEMQYSEGGISVSKRGRGARISVPNCAAQQLVMWVTCIQGQIRFDIARGLTLRPTSHGLIGQFWNIPIKVTPFNFHGQATYDLQMQDLYQIEVSNTNSFPRRFVAELYDLTWDPTRKDHCLYAGDQQGGRILEISNPNDPVIQGVYTFYRTQGLFDSHFQYTQFNESICS